MGSHACELFLIEDLIVRHVGFSAKVGVAIGGIDAFVAGEFLREFQVALGEIRHGDEIVTEIVDADRAALHASLYNARFDGLPHSACGDRADFFTGADVVTGK